MTIAFRVSSALNILKLSVEIGFVEGNQRKDHARRSGNFNDAFVRVDVRGDEIPVAVIFEKRQAREFVLELLVLHDSETSFPYRPLSVCRSFCVRLLGDGLCDGIGAMAVVALKLLRRPPRPFQHQIGLRRKRGRRLTDVHKTID